MDDRYLEAGSGFWDNQHTLTDGDGERMMRQSRIVDPKIGFQIFAVTDCEWHRSRYRFVWTDLTNSNRICPSKRVVPGFRSVFFLDFCQLQSPD